MYSPLLQHFDKPSEEFVHAASCAYADRPRKPHPIVGSGHLCNVGLVVEDGDFVRRTGNKFCELGRRIIILQRQNTERQVCVIDATPVVSVKRRERQPPNYSRLPRALDAQFLNEIVGFVVSAQPSGVDQCHWQATKIEVQFENIACCPCNWCDERRFALCCNRRYEQRMPFPQKSSLPKKLKRVLFPALGGPKIASLMPDRRISPRLPSARKPSMAVRNS